MESRGRSTVRSNRSESIISSSVRTIFIRGTHFMEWTSEFIDGLGLMIAEREMVYEKNAARILKL